MHNQHNYNTDLTTLEQIVHGLAKDLINASIHPNYLKINKILRYDGIQTEQCFADKYGTVEKFIDIYKRGIA